MIKLLKNWKKKRELRKQQKHEQLLRELEEMVDKRRAELLKEKGQK